MTRHDLRNFALKHPLLLNIYRKTFGRLKTDLYFGMQRRALQRNGMNIIDSIDRVLCNNKAKFFVDCGSLLGLARDGKLISHDMDLDFGIYLNDEFSAIDLDKAMDSIGLKKHRAFVYNGNIVETSYSNGLTNIDFFVHFETPSSSNLYVFYKEENVKYPDNNVYSVAVQKRAPIKSLIRRNMGGLDLYIPENLEEYLASAYTDNWRIPDSNWSYFMEPGFTKLEGEYGEKQVELR